MNLDSAAEHTVHSTFSSKNRFEGDDFDINSLLYSTDIATHVVALRKTLYKNIIGGNGKRFMPSAHHITTHSRFPKAAGINIEMPNEAQRIVVNKVYTLVAGTDDLMKIENTIFTFCMVNAWRGCCVLKIYDFKISS